MQPAWDFISKIKEQQPLLGEDPDFTTWFQKGEIDAACTISTNAREAKKNGIEIAWVVPEEGAKFDTDGLWIPKGLPENELYWAKQYINHALTKEAQQIWLDGLGLPGVIPGITPPADLVGDPSYPTTEEDFKQLIRISAKVQVENESQWFAKFKEIMAPAAVGGLHRYAACRDPCRIQILCLRKSILRRRRARLCKRPCHGHPGLPGRRLPKRDVVDIKGGVEHPSEREDGSERIEREIARPPKQEQQTLADDGDRRNRVKDEKDKQRQ